MPSSQRGPNSNGSTTRPARAYSVRMSPFQIRVIWRRPNASSTSSRRSNSSTRFSAGSRSNWIARPIPNNSENSANAFIEMAWSRKLAIAASRGVISNIHLKKVKSVALNASSVRRTVPPRCAGRCRGGRNCAKMETRNSYTMLIAITPNSATPRRMSMPTSRSLTGPGMAFAGGSRVSGSTIIASVRLVRFAHQAEVAAGLQARSCRPRLP